MRIKLLIVGSQRLNSLETIYIKYLKVNDLDIFHIDLSVFYSYSGLINKILYIFSYKTLYKKSNYELLKYVKKCKPNFIWFFKGVELEDKTLLLLKENNIKLIYYNPDHPFIRNSVSHGKKNVEKNLPLFDIHFSYQTELTKLINTKFNLPSYNLPFGYDLTNEDYATINDKEIKRACFVGTPDKERVKTIKYLIGNKIHLDLYGNGWSKFFKNSPYVNIFPSVINLELYKTLHKYRLQLNLFRKHNMGSHNMRFFEIPAVGGIQLCNYSIEASQYFDEGKEIFFFHSNNDLLQKIKTILNYDDTSIIEIRTSARLKSLSSSYSYQSRSNYFFNIITNL
jgi:spore maturation protein CgeB